jgi:hypothetical protein
VFHKHEGPDIIKTLKDLENAIKLKEEELKQHRQNSTFIPNMSAQGFSGFGKEALVGLFPRFSNIANNGLHLFESIVSKFRREADESPGDFLKKIAISSFGLGLILGRQYRYHKLKEKI